MSFVAVLGLELTCVMWIIAVFGAVLALELPQLSTVTLSWISTVRLAHRLRQGPLPVSA